MPALVYPDNSSNPGWSLSGGGGGWGGSGINPPSGNVSAGSFDASDASGPWLIETQTMDYVYSRVPFFNSRAQFPASGLGLSSFDQGQLAFEVDVSPAATTLFVNARATVQSVSSTDMFYTSGYQQPQKFKVFAFSADINGVTYGDVRTGTFGPRGELKTVQKYYRRRRLDHSQDKVFVQTLSQGWNFPVSGAGDEARVMGDYRLSIGYPVMMWDKSSFDSPMLMGYQTNLAYKAGSYNTQMDFTQDLIDVTDDVGTAVMGLPIGIGGLFDASIPGGRTVALTAYSILRHDYT